MANWKSHKSLADAEQWCQDFNHQYLHSPSNEVVIAPATVFLAQVREVIRPEISLGTQDLSSFSAGAYTGALSSKNLQDLGVKYALVGHSERRRYFHETHQDVANKIDQAVLAGIIPVLCLDTPYLEAQLAAINPAHLAGCVIAYEPLEAIGTGENQAAEAVANIVTQIKELATPRAVIYGGSVSAANVSEYLAVSDGVLVGTKSLDVGDFVQLLTAAY